MDAIPQQPTESPLSIDARPYSSTRAAIRDADVLLFRAISWDGRAICVAGRSEFPHAALAAWWGSRLYALEMHPWHGGRLMPLSGYVKQRPGGIVWFSLHTARMADDFSRELAVEAMKDLIGTPYSWWDIYTTSLYHLPVVRFIRHLTLGPPPRVDVEGDNSSFFCSGAVSHALCRGGHDPVPELGNHFVEPGDLARSDFLQRQWALLEG